MKACSGLEVRSEAQQPASTIASNMGFAPAREGNFPSPRHTHVLIMLAMSLLVVTLATCYSLWLADGCLVFLPFVSDLGLHGTMRPVFVAGLVATSLPMIALLPHITVARHHLVQALHLPSGWRKANWMLSAAGASVVLAVGVLGFLPWDRALHTHLLCANIIFGGGVVWAIGSCLLARRFAQAAELETWHACPKVRAVQRAVAAACILDLGFAYCSLGGAYLSSPDLFSWKELPLITRLARDDFGSYCTGEQGWHALAWVNLAALAEWLLVAFLAISVAAAAAADVQAHRVVQCNFAAGIRPFLNQDNMARLPA